MAEYALLGIFVMGSLVYVIESYVIRCPEQAEWNIRAEIQCQNITKYFCLYNYIHYTYEEGCTGPEWEIPGSKRVYSRNFNSAPCNDTRYQPIKFVTNGNSDCIFRKSLCTEEGQTLFQAGTTRTDSTCRCDYKQGYAFVTVPRNKCSCHPSEEDCSCYLKKCQGIGYYLSADYECTKNGTQKTVCSLMSENPSEDPHIDMAPTGTPREYDSYAIKRTYDVAILVSICLFVLIIITVITMYIMLQQRLPRCPCLSTEQDGNTLEEIVSENNKDNEIAPRDENWKSALDQLKDDIDKEGLETALKQYFKDLSYWKNEPVKLAVTGKSGNASSDEHRKSALDKLKDNIYKEGIATALEQFTEKLDNWKNGAVKLAVTGQSGVGKSSFINAIRNLKSGDPGFATSSSAGNTTRNPTIYKYPGNPKITFHDLPGFGTIKLHSNQYVERMELHQYDYILIFVERNIDENDTKIAKALTIKKIPFCFVRSKIDLAIENVDKDGESEINIVEKIKSTFSCNLNHAELKNAKFFVISNHYRWIGEFDDLVLYIESNLTGMKYEAFMFSILGKLSVDEIESKYKILKNRIWEVSVASSSLSIAPVFSLNIVYKLALICKELLLYHKTFGFEQQFVKNILKYDYIRQKLNVSSIIEIQPTNDAMHTFVKIELEKLRTSEAIESPNNLMSFVMWEGLASRETFLLSQVLDACRDDAILVYSHDEYLRAQRLQ